MIQVYDKFNEIALTKNYKKFTTLFNNCNILDNDYFIKDNTIYNFKRYNHMIEKYDKIFDIFRFNDILDICNIIKIFSKNEIIIIYNVWNKEKNDYIYKSLNKNSKIFKELIKMI